MVQINPMLWGPNVSTRIVKSEIFNLVGMFWSLFGEKKLINHILYEQAGLAKSLARRPGAIVFSSRATKMYHLPARRATSPRVLKNS